VQWRQLCPGKELIMGGDLISENTDKIEEPLQQMTSHQLNITKPPI